jgi:hypothetical protein
MRSDLGALVVDECFCQLRSETILGLRCSTAPNVTWNLLVLGSDSRFTEGSRGTKGKIQLIPSDKGLTRSQCATSDVLSRDETANGMDLKLPSRIRLAAHVENESWQHKHRHGFKC